MNFSVESGELSALEADALVLSVAKNGEFSQALSLLDKLSGGFFSTQQANNNLPHKLGATAVFYEVSGIQTTRVMVVCTEQSCKQLPKAVSAVVSVAQQQGWEKIVLALVDKQKNAQSAQSLYQLVMQRVADCVYEFTQFKTKKKQEKMVKQWLFFAGENNENAAKAALKQAQAWQLGTYLTRDLGNLPPNVCHPSYLATQAKKLSKQYNNLTVNVLKRKEMLELGMGALLGVAQGSAQPPRFITMEYKPDNAINKKPVVLVGKGVTFDTGGISLKPGAAMDEMKYDMGGAAAVFGAIKALCHEGLNVHVVGIIAAVENMPDGNAIRPGDILTSLSGKTIEVLNTDAEGRLILCDALTYAERYKPQAVIDLATLTGACLVALGSHRAAVLGNDKKLIDAIYEAGEAAQDPVWPMPLDQEYKDLLKSPFADLPNIASGREAGTITAAAFLSAFADAYPWAHLDIAGVVWRKGKQKGASGRPVGLLLTYLRRLADA